MDNRLILLIIVAASYLIPSFTMFMLFKKGGVKRFLAWIPLINYIYLLKMVDFKWYYIFEYIFTIGACLLTFFTKTNTFATRVIFALSATLFLFYYIRLNVRLAKKFNKKAACILTIVDSHAKEVNLTAEEREKSLDKMTILALESI